MPNPPVDAQQRRDVEPKVCYQVNSLPHFDSAFYQAIRESLSLVDSVTVPPRDAATFTVPAGHLMRIKSVEGPQVGDLNLWNANNLEERFFSGKTRQLHATHVTTGHRLWSNLPHLQALATITHDTLDWYGFDQYGGGIHDVIGTRCDPYTNHLLTQQNYHYCCHSNLTRALAKHLHCSPAAAEKHIHDVLNVFMCTGFTLDTHQYFMKASPVRPGDYLELFAEVDLLGALSACPGGDCGSSHSDDSTPCYPLQVDIYQSNAPEMADWKGLSAQQYDGSHGLG